MGQTWKVGELARLTGLTVRTLRYYDQIGLLRPSARTAAGHRLYAEADVRRLYQVVALRELGLPLGAIGGVLSRGGDVAGLLRRHLAHVDEQVAAVRSVQRRLATLVRLADQAREPSPADLLGLVEEVTKMDETIRTYFSEEQLAQLAQRREALGEEAIAAVVAEWPRLIAQVQQAMDAGTDPTDPAVQALAARWVELLAAFHGGDEGIRAAQYRMYEENAQDIQREYGGPSPELVAYVTRARSAAG